MNATIPQPINIFELMLFANTETNSYFGIVLIMIITISLLIILLRKGELFMTSVGISSFIGLLLCSIFIAIGLVSASWLVYFIAGIIISVLYRYLTSSTTQT